MAEELKDKTVTSTSGQEQQPELSLEMIRRRNKEGKEYEALEVTVGKHYRGLLFPTPLEKAYIKNILNGGSDF